jgi:hypothetical protein
VEALMNMNSFMEEGLGEFRSRGIGNSIPRETYKVGRASMRESTVCRGI